MKSEVQSKDVKHLYTEEYFTGSATGHDEFTSFKGRYDDLIDKFRMILEMSGLKKDESLMDIGCGRGELVIFHSLNGGKATGVDFSQDAIKLAMAKATELNADCRFLNCSFDDIDETEKYDVIISLDFIEHISVNEGVTFYKKCFNLLNENGRLVIFTYPNIIRRRYGYRLIRLFSILKGSPLPLKETDTLSDHYKQYHLNEQSYFTLRESAGKAGFKRTTISYFDMSIKESAVKKALLKTPFRHLFMKGLTMIARK